MFNIVILQHQSCYLQPVIIENRLQADKKEQQKSKLVKTLFP